MRVSAAYDRDEANNVEGVYFRYPEFGVLAVVRSLEFNDSDRELGQDTYALTWDTGETYYGGIREWITDEPDHAFMMITPEAAEALDNPDGYFDLEMEPAELDAIQPHVARFVSEGGGTVTDERA